MNRTHIIAVAVGVAIGFTAARLSRSIPEGFVAVDPPAGKRMKTEPRLKGALDKPSAGAEKLEGDMDLSAVLLEPAAEEDAISAYVESHDYSKEALIAAASLSSERSYIMELARRFPNDPHVQFLVISKDALPGEKSAWIRRFKESQPDNGLASLYLGGDLLTQGAAEQGLAQMRLAAAQEIFEDFSTARMLAIESALIELGRSPLETKLRSTFGLELPQVGQISAILKDLRSLAEQSSNPDETTELATLGVALGNQLSQGNADRLLVNKVVGLAIESQFLKMLDPNLESANFSQSPAVLLEEIEAENAQIKNAIPVAERVTELSEQQIIHYMDRVRATSELEAIQWLRGQLSADE